MSLASRDTGQPGVYADELTNVLPALVFVNGGPEAELVEGTGPSLTIGDHSMHIMTMPYLGGLKTLAFVPVVDLFGVNPTSVRLLAIAVAALALLATFAFTRRLFRDQWIATIAVVLLAVDPSFFFFSREDWGPTNFMLLTKAVAGWQLLRWWDTDSRWSLALGSFAAGLGLWDKGNFGWILAAGGLALLVVAGRTLLARLTARDGLVAAGAFAAGALPLIVYNLRSGFGTVDAVRDLGQNVLGLPSYPFDEPTPGAGLASEVLARFETLSHVLDGSSVSRLLGSPIPSHFEVLPVIFALGAIVACGLLFTSNRGSREARAGVFLVLFALGVIAAATATDSGYHAHHLLLVYPLPHMVLALAIVLAARYVAGRLHGRRNAFAVAAVLLAAVPAVLAGITTAGVMSVLDETDGLGLWSARISDLERSLGRDRQQSEVVTVDWGLGPPLYGLSQGKLKVTELSYALQDRQKDPQSVLSRPLRNPGARYVLHSEDTTVYSQARQRFFRAIRRTGTRMRMLRAFRGEQGRVVYEVYSVARRRG